MPSVPLRRCVAASLRRCVAASLRCVDHADFAAAVRAYLDALPRHQRVEHAAVAIANPVEGDRVRMTNYHWEFSIEQTRQQLGFDTLLEFYTVAQYGGVALDAQYMFLRFGIPSAAYTDPRLQTLAVNMLKPGDVAVVISSGSRLRALRVVADIARLRGAVVVAITASQIPLALTADTVLAANHVEDSTTQVPRVSRILQLLMVDILAVGVALRHAPLADQPAPFLA